ncbi:phage portal protein [Microvirga brassicacearum]|nr:phage portal protein [Microvirga brassicacearum]
MLIDTSGRPLINQSKPQSAYFRQNKSPFLSTWKPVLREGSDDVRAGWQLAAARAIDAIQNNGFMSGIVDASAASVVGQGLQLASRPDGEALGWSETYKEEWAAKVEREFRAWANVPMEVDGGARMTFYQMQIAAYKCWMFYGEILAMLPMRRRQAGGSLTKILLLPPSRIADETEEYNRLVHGVRMDDLGAPIAYRIRQKSQFGYEVSKEFRARDRDGRPNVLHIFDPSIASPRGISPLAPVLKVCQQVDQLADATIAAALLQTMFAATIQNQTSGLAGFSGLLTEEEQAGGKTLDMDVFMDAQNAWYDSNGLNLNTHGRIAHLFPNDKLEFHEAKHPSENYDNFAGWLMREIARCAGLTYEEATMDFRSATYSSVRMGTAQIWPIVLNRRTNIVNPFSQAGFEAWLEEKIGEGRIPFPGGLEAFFRNKAAACGAWWNGPAAPQADDLKTARAHQTLKDMGATTLEAVSASYGRDWRDDMKQRARERDFALKLGLPDPHADPLEKKAEFSRAEQGDDADKSDDPSFAPDNPGSKRSRSALNLMGYGRRKPDAADLEFEAEWAKED